MNKVMFFNISENEVIAAGYQLEDHYDNSLPFLCCEDPKAFFEGWRSSNTQILGKLSGHKDEWVRLRVAENPHTPQMILESLAGDLSHEVAHAARKRFADTLKLEQYFSDLQQAQSKHLSPHTIGRLANHRWMQIRLACVEQTQIDNETLQRLVRNSGWEIQLAVLCCEKSNARSKYIALEYLLKSSFNVQLHLSEHRKSPPELLEALEKVATDERVLNRIALHPNNKKRSRFVD